MNKNAIIFLMIFFGLINLSNATLTPGNIPVTKTGGSSPTIQNGSITDTGTSSGVGNVGVGSSSPGVRLDVSGTIRATAFIGNGVSNTTFTVCSSTANSSWHCDYTATGTNDQTVINSAITAANALTNGGKVLLSEGNFSIGTNGTSIIPLSNVWLQGSGMTQTILLATTGLGNNAVVLSSGTISNTRFSDFKIDGTAQRANAWNVQQKGISMSSNSGTNNKYDHLWIYHTPATCLAPDGQSNLTVDNNIFDTCGTTGQGNGANGFPEGNNGFGYGMSDNNINKNVLVSNNLSINVADAGLLVEEQSGETTCDYGFQFINNIGTGNYNAIRASGACGVVITGNQAFNNLNSGIAVVSDTNANIPSHDITVTSNYSYNNTLHGFVFYDDTATNSPIYEINFNDNTAINNSGDGVYFHAEIANLQGNILDSNALSGINLSSVSTYRNVKINNNYIAGNGTANTAGNNSGITVLILSTKTMSNLDISNNHIFADGSGFQKYGVDYSGIIGTPANFSLSNNDLAGNVTAAINSVSSLVLGSTFFSFNNNGYTTGDYFPDLIGFNGNVGIGTIVPQNKLDVQGTVSLKAFEVTVSGNVGIGSLTPGQVLDVQGTLARIRVGGVSGQAAGTLLCTKADGTIGYCTGVGVTLNACATCS